MMICMQYICCMLGPRRVVMACCCCWNFMYCTCCGWWFTSIVGISHIMHDLQLQMHFISFPSLFIIFTTLSLLMIKFSLCRWKSFDSFFFTYPGDDQEAAGHLPPTFRTSHLLLPRQVLQHRGHGQSWWGLRRGAEGAGRAIKGPYDGFGKSIKGP